MMDFREPNWKQTELTTKFHSLWEYKIVTADDILDSEAEKFFNSLGGKGWELVIIYKGRLFFKRQKSFPLA